MDYENTDDQGMTGGQAGAGGFPGASSMGSRAPEKIIYVEKPPKRSGWRIFWRIVFSLSILANIFMFLMLVVLSAMFLAQGQNGFYVEETIASGDKANKVVVIRLEGVINAKLTRDVCKQIKAAKADPSVKALIIRTNTPGGGVAASDQINHEIKRFRGKTGKPVVAFMQSVAASGGYYTSVACNSIVAEPTVITGSIGVIMQVLGVQELFEDKLGINPVTIKSGERKDWPNMFKDMTEEQKTYLENKVIMPAYRRFVDLVFEGRKDAFINSGRTKDVMSRAEIRQLADGSIYGADEALEKGLIDEIGYIEDVINTVKSLTGLGSIHVVEYAKPFSLSNLMGVESKFGINIDSELIDEVTTPRLQYLWKPGK